MSRGILRFFQKRDFNMDLKERIKALCKNNGVTINKLEKTLGFGTGYVAKLNNSVPNTAKIKLIADFFNVSVDYLLGSENYQMDNETHTWDFVIDNKDMKILVEAMSDKDNADRLIAYAKKLIELKNMEDL